MPYTNASWLAMLDAEPHRLENHMKNAMISRRVLSQRLEPLDDMLPEPRVRVYTPRPRVKGEQLPWAKLLRAELGGFYLLRCGKGNTLVVFAARARSFSWGVALREVAGPRFDLDTSAWAMHSGRLHAFQRVEACSLDLVQTLTFRGKGARECVDNWVERGWGQWV